MSGLLISGMVLIFLLAILWQRVPPTLVSPVHGFIAMYLFTFLGGALAYDPQFSPAWFLSPSRAEISAILNDVLWIVSAFIGGALLVTGLSRRRQALRRSLTSLNGLRLSPLHRNIGLSAALLCITLTVLGYGPATLWYSEQYLKQEDMLANIAASMLSLASALVLGAAAALGSARQKRLAFVLEGVILILMAAISTRRLALLPLLFAVGGLVVQPARRAWRAGLLAALVLCPFIMMIPLAMREMDAIGIRTLARVPALVTKLDVGWQFQSSLNNLFMSLPITIESAKKSAADPMAYVLTGISPLPGRWTDWYENQIRINIYMPFNAVGDLLRAGLGVTLAYYAFIGAWFARIELRLKAEGRLGPAGLMLLGLCFAFIVFSLQYPLRSATRMIYYMMALEASAWLLSTVQSTRSHRANNAASENLCPERIRSGGSWQWEV
jgi:hypothetical protein